MLRIQYTSLARMACWLATVFLAAFLVASESTSHDAMASHDGFGRPDAPANRIAGQVLQVDGQAAPRARLHILGHEQSGIDAWITADDQGHFECEVHCSTDALAQLQLIATSQDGGQAAFHRFAWEANQRTTEGFTIALESLRIATVEVTDQHGVPVDKADVAFQLGWPHILTGATTDASGIATASLPASERIEGVLAWKDHAGLDYRLYSLPRHQRADVKAVAPEFPRDQPERLVLAGVRPLTIQFDDASGQPLQDVAVYAWVLTNPDAPASLNLSYFTSVMSQKSGLNGEALFAWLPQWQQKALTFLPSASGYESIRINYDPTTDQQPLRVVLHQLVPIRGRVVDAAGKPMSDIEIKAIGRGRAFNEFRDTTRTDADGRYEILVAPHQVYLLVVANDQWAAAPQTGFAVFPDEPLENCDFQLREPTRLHGQLLDERTREPIPNEHVIVYQYGIGLHDMPGVEIPNPENERYGVQPIEQYYATTNERGEFEFRLGDGNFDLRPPQYEKVERFSIASEREVEMNVTTTIQREVELVGLVIDKERSKPLAGATIHGVPRSLMGSEWRAETGEDGKFRVLRREQATYVKATNPDGSLAAIVEVGDNKRTFIIPLQPTGSVHGRLVDMRQQPLVGQKLLYGVDVPDTRNETWTNRFGGTIVTDSKGEFELRGLVAGWEYHIYFPATPEGRIPQLTRLTLTAGEHRELGDLRMPDNR